VTRGVVVVTGGASGFGRALGDRFASLGYSVALLDIDGDRAKAEAAALARVHGVPTIGRQTDVGDSAEVDAAADAVTRALGDADLVFSNVGVQQIGALEGVSDDTWAWMLDVNVIGAARVVRSFLPQLRRTRGRIVFTASSSVLVPAPRLAAYQASKFAVLGLAETLRHELAADAIGVSVVFPSAMLTRHLESSLAARPAGIDGEIAPDADVEALVESNQFITSAATAESAAGVVVDEVLAGEPYVVTHGDLVQPLLGQQDLVRRAAERARDRSR
jgi:NAD(P)-dependent dehydrogenase (short-subunit alcohol dehydrogenase family)